MRGGIGNSRCSSMKRAVVFYAWGLCTNLLVVETLASRPAHIFDVGTGAPFD